MSKLLYTDAVIVSYEFLNPRPKMQFVRTNEEGVVEHWQCEGAGSPSMLIRWGWRRLDILNGLQTGAKVKVGVALSRSSPLGGIVLEVYDGAVKPILLAKPKTMRPTIRAQACGHTAGQADTNSHYVAHRIHNLSCHF